MGPELEVGEPGGREPAPPPLDLVQALVNTNDREGGHDALATMGAARSWLREAGFAVSAITEEDRRRLARFRESLRALARANNGAPADPDALAVLNEEVSRSRVALVFDPASAHLEPTRRGIDGAIGRVVASVFAAMIDGTWTRLKSCRRDVCRWVFYDHSRNRSGIWCTMEICGNRVKTTAYWRRRSAARS